MIHSIILLLIIQIAIINRCACDENTMLDAISEIKDEGNVKGVGKAEGFFDYNLCKAGGDGLQWKCYYPSVCFDGGETVHLQEVDMEIEKLRKCHALLAIQQQSAKHSEISKIWRVVMQIQVANDNVGVEHGVKFYHGKRMELDCRWSKDKIYALKQPDTQFEITQVKAMHDNTKLMCEFVINFFEKEKFMAYVKKPFTTTGIEWRKKNGIDIGKAELDSALMDSDANSKAGCLLTRLEFENLESPDLLVTDLNRDRTTITCPTGYAIRKKEKKFYEIMTKFVCHGVHLTEYFASGKSSEEVYSTRQVHCARKKCKDCAAPTCSNTDTKKCPTTPKITDYESCSQLQCDADLFKFGGQVHVGKPLCTFVKENGEEKLKWMLNDTEVNNVECGNKVFCPDALTAVRIAYADQVTSNKEEILCKNNMTMSISTKDGDKGIKLSKLTCSFKDGIWHEVHVDGPETVPYSGGSVQCTVEGFSQTAAQAGNKYMMWVGISLAIILLLCGALFLIFCCCKRASRKRDSANKHKLATKSSKSKEGRSKDTRSKSNITSSNGATEAGVGVSTDHSVTQKNSKKDRQRQGSDKPDITTSGGSNPKKDEERAKQAGLNAEDYKKKTAALLESSKMEQDEEQEGEVPRIDTAMLKKGHRKTAIDGSMQPKTPQYRITLKDPFAVGTPVNDPARGADVAQQQAENGQDEAGAQTPTPAAGTPVTPKPQPQTPQQGTEGEDDEAEQSMWPKQPQHAGTPVDSAADSAAVTPRDQNSEPVPEPTNKTTTGAGTEEEAAASEPQPDNMKTGREKAKVPDAEKDKPVKPVKEEKSKSKKQWAAQKAREAEPNEKEKKSKKGAKRNYKDTPSVLESDNVSSRSSKKGGAGGRKVDEPSRKPEGHTHVHGSEAGCGPLCMPMSPAVKSAPEEN